MIVDCQLTCNDNQLTDMGVDEFKWLPFTFKMDDVKCFQMATDRTDHFTYRKTTIYLGDDFMEYTIDIEYVVFRIMFKKYHSEQHVFKVN